MANTAELGIYLRCKDDASKVLGDVQKKAGGLGKAFGDMAKIAGGFVMAQGIMAAPGFLMDAAQAAANETASLMRLQKAVENSGGSWDIYGKQLDAVVEAGMKKGFDDDAQRAAGLAARRGAGGEALRP